LQAGFTADQFLKEGRAVIAASVSAISVVLGAAIAYTANGHPRHREAMETAAGVLIIAGLALLGYALECAIGRP
jgi:hypothetical protein